MPNGDWVGRAAVESAGGRPLVLVFDYDTALAVPYPRSAGLPGEARALLAGLMLAGPDRVAVGVVSGRGLAELRRLVGLPGVLYAGSGGMHLDLAGDEVIDPGLVGFGGLADAVVGALAAAVGWFPGAWIETRPGVVAVHGPRLTPLKAACLRDEVREVVASLSEAGPPLRVRETAGVIEIGPAAGWGLGDAVGRMLERLRPDALPVYLGDAAADPDAAARAADRGGAVVGGGPDAVAADLARLAAALGVRELDEPVIAHRDVAAEVG